MTSDFGRVCVLTGATGGIGRAIAEVLAESANGEESAVGCLILSDHPSRSDPLDELAEGLRKRCDKRIDVMTVDLLLRAEVDSFAVSIRKTYRRVDYLINNAGIALDGSFIMQSLDRVRTTVEVNLLAPLHLCKVFGKMMARQKFGRIINIASVVGLIGNKYQVAYAASKAGLIMATKSLAKELSAPEFGNITVNVVAPGFIDTEMTRDLPEEVKQSYIEQIPMKKLGQPEDVARAVEFLLFGASYVTGEVVSVNGGMH